MGFFKTKSTTQNEKIRVGHKKLHEAQFWRSRLDYFLGVPSPSSRENTNQVPRRQCRLGYVIGGPARLREKHSDRAPYEARRLCYFPGRTATLGTEKNRRWCHIRIKCRHRSVAVVTCPAARYRSGGTPTNGGDMIGRRWHLGRVALVFSPLESTPRAEQKQ